MTIDLAYTMLAHKLLTGDLSCYLEAVLAEWLQAIGNARKSDAVDDARELAVEEASDQLVARLVRIVNLLGDNDDPRAVKVFGNGNGGGG